MKRLSALLILIIAFWAAPANAQFSRIVTVTAQNNNGTQAAIYASPFTIKAGANCTWSISGTVATFNCSGSGGSSSFSAITTGTNTTAAMTLGSGSSILETGTGKIDLSGGDDGGFVLPTFTNEADVAGSLSYSPDEGYIGNDGMQPVQFLTSLNYQNSFTCGTLTDCSGADPITNPGAFIYTGEPSLVSGTPSAVTVSGLAFSDVTSYVCTISDETSATSLIKYTKIDESSFTITGPAAVTDKISYICVGN